MFFDLFSRPKAVESTGYLKTASGVVPYRLWKKRCKWLRMVVDENGLRVTAPLRLSEEKIEKALMEKIAWVQGQLDIYKNAPKPWQEIQSGDKVKFLGEDCLVLVSSSSGWSRVSLTHGVFNLNLNETRSAKRVLQKWFIEQARQVIGERVELYSPKFGATVQGISIKGQKTRWGSCSSKGNLNFNWKLAMAPLEVIDYLVIHELAHLKEFNHSKVFWSSVATHCPEYKQREKWLKDNGHLLSF